MSATKVYEDTAVKSHAKCVVDGPAQARSRASTFGSSPFLTHLIQIPCLVWAFTESNFITFVLPNTAFGVLGALAGPELLQNDTGAVRLTSATILWPILLAIAFNWTNVLIFDIQNQTAPQSLAEDLANKPWRPIPSGRITTQQARRSMFLAIPICLALNRALGAEREGLYIQIGSYVYNDLRGGDSRARDFLIAIAFALFNTASLRIAAGALLSASQEPALAIPGHPAPPLQPQLSPNGLGWVALISVVILTTMQVQDLKDQAGDRLRGRWTVPLAFGDWTSRISLALLVPFWTVVCACVWWPRRHWTLILPPVLIGALVALRVLIKKTPKADSNTWKLWCLWGVGLYYLAPASLI